MAQCVCRAHKKHAQLVLVSNDLSPPYLSANAENFAASFGLQKDKMFVPKISKRYNKKRAEMTKEKWTSIKYLYREALSATKAHADRMEWRSLSEVGDSKE